LTLRSGPSRIHRHRTGVRAVGKDTKRTGGQLSPPHGQAATDSDVQVHPDFPGLKITTCTVS